MVGFSGTREWVEVQSIKGKFTTLRRWTFLALHLILFVTPWVKVGGHPAMLIDLPARQVYAFGQIFTAADTLLLLIVLLFLAFTLFFFTSLYGRLWCGYACPQTVFLETWIRPIEMWIEGDRSTRLRRRRQGVSFDLVWRRGIKWGVFAVVAFVAAMAFVSYFAGAADLWTWHGGAVEYSIVGVFTFVFFWDFAWFREQFCNYLCPYARFQGALTDDETVQVTYFPDRGEPRGGKTAAKDGRCIDCNKCVIVCPAGIDIRDGFQLECIACSRCIDACTGVMEQLGHRTLVGLSSVSEMQGKTRPRKIRPRTVVYAAMLTGLVALGLTLVGGRVPFEASVNRAPGSLYTVDDDGSIRNTYLLKVTSNDPSTEAVRYEVRVEGLEGAEVVAPDLELGSTETRTLPLVVRVQYSEGMARTIPIQVHVTSPSGELSLEATFKTGAELGTTAPTD
jgi:cytochrome c oxidase accessory protein FixG